MPGFDAIDDRHRIGRYLVRRARPEDATDFSRADAELVSAAYADLMPAQFGPTIIGRRSFGYRIM